MASTTLPTQGMDWVAPLMQIIQSLGGTAPGGTTLGTPFPGGVPPTQLGTSPVGSPTTLPHAGYPSISMPDWNPNRETHGPPYPTQLGENPQDYGTRFEGSIYGDIGIPDFGVPDLSTLAMAGIGAIPGALPGIATMNLLRGADSKVKGPQSAAAAPAGLPPLPTHDEMLVSLGMKEPEAPTDPNAIGVEFDVSKMPKPPTYGEPPKYDEEKLQASTRLGILAGLASGAGGVDPSSPGAFARALAMAGAGGAGAASEAAARETEVAFKNATNAYNTAMKNKELEYGYEQKKFELMAPKIEATKDAAIIQEYKDGKLQVRVIDTDGPLGDASKLKTTIEAMGMSGPAAEATEVQYIAKFFGHDPAAMKTNLTRMAIERTIQNGAGNAVFGDAYDAARTTAEQRVPVGLMNDPEEYTKWLTKEISAIILSNPETMTNPEWLTKAGTYGSVAAQILAGKNG